MSTRFRIQEEKTAGGVESTSERGRKLSGYGEQKKMERQHRRPPVGSVTFHLFVTCVKRSHRQTCISFVLKKAKKNKKEINLSTCRVYKRQQTVSSFLMLIYILIFPAVGKYCSRSILSKNFFRLLFPFRAKEEEQTRRESKVASHN